MNLYWSIYESLEKETLSLADSIFFDDKQLDVYSVKLGNLIVRCAIEIEALSKELYIGLGGEPMILDEKETKKRYPYFDTECLNLLVREWKIDKKKIQIKNPKMYFTKDISILTPLLKANKKGTSSSKWQQAYQNVKHNRAQKRDEATVRNLLGALGALYILNLYYRDESFWYEVPIEGREEYRTHSKIFSPFVYDVPGTLLAYDEQLKEDTIIPFDECIYLKKYTDNSAIKIRDLMYSYNLSISLQTITSDAFLKYKKEHPDEQETIDASFIRKLGLDFSKMSRNINVSNIPPEVYKSKEIVLNKCQQIYPQYTYEDFLRTAAAQKIVDDNMIEFNRKRISL